MAAQLILDVRIDGFPEPAGYLSRDAGGDTAFAYAEGYLASGRAPLSLSLPVREQPFGDVLTRAFFQNLLPENNQLEAVMAQHGLDRGDVVGLLSHLGADCAGALSCLPLGSGPAKTPGVLAQDYDAFAPADLSALARELSLSGRLSAGVRDPSPLAGAQRKLALTLLPDGRFAQPKPGRRVPSTHILKVPNLRDAREARLEAQASRLARAVGLPVAVSEALDLDGTAALLAPRFDRIVEGGKVYRLHQEDFAQALGLPAGLKYQRDATAAGRRFDAEAVAGLLRRTAEPALAAELFLKTTMFNLLIGNTDNHAKNHALLYDTGGPTPRLAPLYDLVPIRMSAQYTHQLAFDIGAATTFDALTAADLGQFFGIFGLSGPRLARFLDEEIAAMVTRLEAATLTMDRGLKDFDDLIGRETERLVETMGLTTPVRERDYFEAR